MSTTNIHIMRTAAELWELAGPDMWLYGWTDDHCAMLQGKGDRCIMPTDEFAEYQRMRRRWQDAGRDVASQDLAGAPSVSMLVATAKEDAETRRLGDGSHTSYRDQAIAGRQRQIARRKALEEDGLKPELPTLPVSHFARAFNVMESLLLAHQASLDEEDREEMLRRLAGQMMTLKEDVLRAEEIWAEMGGETRRLGDLETLKAERDHEAERANEAQTIRERLAFELMEQRIENRRLEGLLEQKAGAIISDLSAKLEAQTLKLLKDMEGGPGAA